MLPGIALLIKICSCERVASTVYYGASYADMIQNCAEVIHDGGKLLRFSLNTSAKIYTQDKA